MVEIAVQCFRTVASNWSSKGPCGCRFSFQPSNNTPDPNHFHVGQKKKNKKKTPHDIRLLSSMGEGSIQIQSKCKMTEWEVTGIYWRQLGSTAMEAWALHGRIHFHPFFRHDAMTRLEDPDIGAWTVFHLFSTVLPFHLPFKQHSNIIHSALSSK